MKTLRRSTTNRTIAGICGGIAEYFSLDPVLIRLVFVLLAIFGGSGILLYIILWFVVPERNPNDNIQDAEIIDEKKKPIGDELRDNFEGVKKDARETRENVRHSSGWIGYFLLFLGGLLLLRVFGWVHFSWYALWQFWPVLLIFIGVSIIPMKSWLRVTVLTLCLVGMLAALMTNPHRGWYCSKAYSVNVSRNVLAVTTSRDGENAELEVDAGACKLSFFDTTEYLSTVSLNGKEMSHVELTKENERQNNKFKLDVNDGEFVNPHARLALNANPVWNLELNVGAADVKMDLSVFKVEDIEINSGAANIDVTIGTLYPKTKIEVSTGASDITVRIPKNADCKVVSESFLISKNLDGFSKSKGIYRTDNFGLAQQTIIIEIDGAISNFEVIRY